MNEESKVFFEKGGSFEKWLSTRKDLPDTTTVPRNPSTSDLLRLSAAQERFEQLQNDFIISQRGQFPALGAMTAFERFKKRQLEKSQCIESSDPRLKGK